jgi:hypothetical protein
MRGFCLLFIVSVVLAVSPPDDCAICLQPFQGYKAGLPCHHSHAFHEDCIRQWLISPNNGQKCPLCRERIPDLKAGILIVPNQVGYFSTSADVIDFMYLTSGILTSTDICLGGSAVKATLMYLVRVVGDYYNVFEPSNRSRIFKVMGFFLSLKSLSVASGLSSKWHIPQGTFVNYFKYVDYTVSTILFTRWLLLGVIPILASMISSLFSQ